MQTPSKKRTTKDVEDDATQQGHKSSKCSSNGGTTAMQTELVDAATPNNIILPLCQPCSPNDNNTTLSEALAADTSTSTNNNSVHTTHHRDNNHQSEIFRCRALLCRCY